MISINSKRAFNILKHEKISKIFRKKDIPEKLIRLIMKIHEDASSRILHKRKQNNIISARAGVRQGGLLSSLLVNVVLGSVLLASKTEKHGISWSLTRQLADLDYADNIGLLSHTFNVSQCEINKFVSNANIVGL